MSEISEALREDGEEINYWNHLHFNLWCLQEDITPRSIRLTSNVKGFRAYKILANASQGVELC